MTVKIVSLYLQSLNFKTAHEQKPFTHLLFVVFLAVVAAFLKTRLLSSHKHSFVHFFSVMLIKAN